MRDYTGSKEILWGVFKVAGNLYALDSMKIAGISLVPKVVTPVPDAEVYVEGIIRFGGDKVVTLLSLRKLFGEKTEEEEWLEFCEMLDSGKDDHLKWVKTLENCVEMGEKVKLETNPHRCAFGKWYDAYQAPDSQIEFELKKIEEPHKNLHEAANKIQRILETSKLDEAEKKTECSKILDLTRKNCLEPISRALEDLKIATQNNKKTMMIILESEEERSVGVLVDEIVGVEYIGEYFSPDVLAKMTHSDILDGVAARTDKSLVFLLDETKILELGNEIEL